jgi:hypothetical protein
MPHLKNRIQTRLGMAQLVELLVNMCETLGLILRTRKKITNADGGTKSSKHETFKI